MIYYESDLAPVIESIYLEESLDNRLGLCNILVNPERLDYMFGKTVIINDPNYLWQDAIKLMSQGCKVISRIKTSVEGISYQPYILNVNMSILWNGETIDLRDNPLPMNEILSLLVSDHDQKFKYDIDKRELYFPKIKTRSGTKDIYGNLSALGWALNQVGENQIDDEKFKNLDLIKTNKVF
jgi:hypothetical protein